MISDALLSFVLLLILIFFIYGPWQWLWTDITRQTIFEKRDRIFDIAVAGRLDFASDEYRTIRKSLEQSIRFAHLITLPHLIMTFISTRNCERPKSSRLEDAIKKIGDPQTQAEVNEIIGEANRVMLRAMAFKSPVFLLVLTITFLLAVAARTFGRINKLWGFDLRQPDSLILQSSARLGSFVELEAEAAFPA